MDTAASLQAVVQTFHIDQEHMGDLGEGLDSALERLSQSPHFGGLLCLERDARRQQVTVIVLWRADAMEDFAPEVADAHSHIAATTDLGVTSQCHRVVRFALGADALVGALDRDGGPCWRTRSHPGRHLV